MIIKKNLKRDDKVYVTGVSLERVAQTTCTGWKLLKKTKIGIAKNV